MGDHPSAAYLDWLSILQKELIEPLSAIDAEAIRLLTLDGLDLGTRKLLVGVHRGADGALLLLRLLQQSLVLTVMHWSQVHGVLCGIRHDIACNLAVLQLYSRLLSDSFAVAPEKELSKTTTKLASDGDAVWQGWTKLTPPDLPESGVAPIIWDFSSIPRRPVRKETPSASRVN